MPVKKSHKEQIEYRLLIDKVYDETLKQEGIRFLLETVKQFANFHYLLDVEDLLEKKLLTWKLHGLRAPLKQMPAHGAATAVRIYYNLNGTFTFSLSKTAGTTETLTVKALKNSLTVSPPKQHWLKIYLNEHEFEEQRTNDGEVPQQKPDIHRKK
ncbi:MAG: hypothetical protein H3C35_04380 [Bacteroidetes bacterium]|nr:hypothetical protein [Bacteroidota bacterium]